MTVFAALGFGYLWAGAKVESARVADSVAKCFSRVCTARKSSA